MLGEDHWVQGKEEGQQLPPSRRWIGAGVGLGLVALSWGALWGAGVYLQEQVLPQVEESLSQAMGRQVELGKVTFLSPWQLRLGESRIEHLATIASIEISPDFWTWIQTGEWVLNLTLDQVQLLWMETLDRGWGDIRFHLQEEGSLPIHGLNIRLRRGTLTAIPLVGQRRTFDRLQAQAQIGLGGDPQAEQRGGQARFQASARLQSLEGLGGYPVQLRGVADFSQAAGSVWVSSPRLPLDLVPSLLPRVPLTDLEGEAGLQLQVAWGQEQPLQLTGEVHLQQARFGVEALPHPFEKVSGKVQFDKQGLFLEQVRGIYGRLPLEKVEGSLTFAGPEEAGLNLRGEVAGVSVAQVQETFALEWPVAVEAVLGGSLTLQGPLTQPELRGQLQALAPGRVDRIPLSHYGLDFRWVNQTLTFERLDLTAEGAQVQGSGYLHWGSPQVQGEFQLQVPKADAKQLLGFYGASLPQSVGPVSAQVKVTWTGSQPQIQASWETPGGEMAGRGELRILADSAAGVVEVPQAVLTLAGGQIVGSGRWAAGRVEAQLAPQNLPLAVFNPGVQGSLTGNITAQLETAAVSQWGFLGALRAQGEVVLSQPLGKITGQLAWDGSGLQIQQAQVLGLATVEGRIPVDPKTLQVGSLDLGVRAEEVVLAEIPGISGPVEGVLRGEGRIQGSLEDWQMEGNAQLEGLRVGGIAFEALSGPFRWSQEGVKVDLQGQQDRLALHVDAHWQPLGFQVRRGEAEAIGTRQEDDLQVRLNRFPLPVLAGWVADVEGSLTADLAMDLRKRTVQGQAAVADLRLAGVAVEGISLTFDYRPDCFTLTQAQLNLFESTYTASGTICLPAGTFLTPGDPKAVPEIQLQLSTSQGRLEDLISTFQWRQWQDVARRGIQLPPRGPASALETEPVGLPGHPLMEQLQYYSQRLAAHLKTVASRMDPLIPPPSRLRGEFQAKVTLAGKINQPSVSFQLQGRNWQAEAFALETVTATGRFADGAVILEPLQLSSGKRQASFSGILGWNEQSGSLHIQGLPLALVDRFLPAELDLAGDLNLDLELAGNLRDPHASGSLTVLNAQINQVPLREVSGQFDYRQGQLRVNTTLLANGDEPIRLVGLVPYTLPFAQVRADSDQMDLTLQAQRGGLRLLNLLTDQVRWEGGDSQLELTIQGTLQEPRLQGNLKVKGGTLRLAALPEPITDLNGQIAFNLNQLEVQELSGRFGQGSLWARGLLPLNSRGALPLGEPFQPLSLHLQGIHLHLPQLYRGQVEGEVVVRGLLLQPLLEGRLQLSQGMVEVSPRPQQIPAAASSSDPPLWQPRLNGLELALGSDLQIVRPNLFEFTASGSLRLFGPPQDLRPAGAITLERGRVRLPLATFRLDRSRRNIAVFDLDNGLDPFLDLRLLTQATEVYRFPQEISPFDTNRHLLGSQQSIDIFATITGRASQLESADPASGILALSSSPSRSPEEIVALLGGTALAGLNAEAGVAGLAGTALLNDLREALGESLGLDEVRLSPVPQIDTRAPNRSSVGLALEVAKDLGSSLSVSVRRNLTDPFQPTRYSARYRLNEQTLTRASTDLEGNNVISVEFETRF